MNSQSIQETYNICGNRALFIYNLLKDAIPTICNSESMRIENCSVISINFPTGSYLYGVSIAILFNGYFEYETAIYNSRRELVYDSTIGYSDVRTFKTAENLINEILRLSCI